MIPVRHIGPEGCNEIAFYFKKRLYAGHIVSVENVVLVSGEPALVTTKRVCGHCEKSISFTPECLQQEAIQ